MNSFQSYLKQATGSPTDAPNSESVAFRSRSVQRLRQYAAEAKKSRDSAVDAREFCELCSQPLGPAHRHLLEMGQRQVVCACDPCALRFELVVDGRYKLIPRDPHELDDFRVDDDLWESFALPINLVFFFHSSRVEKTVALYPSPAGATESLLPLESWSRLVNANPVLGKMEEDVQALLVNRLADPHACFLAPMDRCYALVGLIRMHWRGLSGGREVWDHVGRFFDALRKDARPLPGKVAAASNPVPS